MKKLILITILLINVTGILTAQRDTLGMSPGMFSEVKSASEINKNDVYQPDKELTPRIEPLSSYEFYLSLIVISFGLIALLIEVWLIHRKKIDQDNVIKFIVLTLIITSTLFLITAGYSNNQIAPAMGLLGTIAGYLLGKSGGKGETDG